MQIMLIFTVLHRPKDFVVTELFSDGQLVTLNGTATPYQTDASKDALLGSKGQLSKCLKTNDNPQTRVQLCEDDPFGGPTKHQINQSDTSERPMSNHQSPNLTTIPHLEKLVSPDTYQQLVSMAELNSATTSTEPPSSLNLGERMSQLSPPLHTHSLSLPLPVYVMSLCAGVVEEKSERRWLHRAVRQAFP